jgi:cytochrome c oxidase subunit 2
MLDALPQGISSFAPDIDRMLWIIYYLTGAFFIGMEGYLVYLVIRYRARKGVVAKYEQGNTLVQIQWILIFSVVILVLDLTLDFLGAKTWDRVKVEMPSDTVMTVRVQAKQFDWTFFYPGADGQLGTADDISSYREFHVPVGKKIALDLTSLDVIHDFFLAEVRMKQDVMPLRHIKAWFDANQTGDFHIVCDEICGIGHTRMTGVLKVEDQDAFDNWLAAKDKEQHGGAK